MWREVRFSAERSAVQTTALFANVYLCVTGGLQPEKHPRACNLIFVRSTNNAHVWMLLSTTSNRHCVRVGVDVRRGARALCNLWAPLEALAILAEEEEIPYPVEEDARVLPHLYHAKLVSQLMFLLPLTLLGPGTGNS